MSALLSQTNIGTADHQFQSVINVGTGTKLTAVGSHANPAQLQIEAKNDITAIDHVRIEGVGLFNISAGFSRITTNSLAAVNLTGATVDNKSGDVYITTRTDAHNRPSANLVAAGTITGVPRQRPSPTPGTRSTPIMRSSAAAISMCRRVATVSPSAT